MRVKLEGSAVRPLFAVATTVAALALAASVGERAHAQEVQSGKVGVQSTDRVKGGLNGQPICEGKVVTVNLAKGQKPTKGNDVILGTNGNDKINGLAGDDTICGRGGDDIIQGGSDSIINGTDDDLINGGTGHDTASYSSAPTAVTVDLTDAFPQKTGPATGFDKLKLVEDARGGAKDDVLVGNDGANGLFGGAGFDKLSAGGGPDRLVGGPDDDDCDGGAGVDTKETCETSINIP